MWQKNLMRKSASMELSSRRWMVTPEVVQHFLFRSVTGKPILYVGMGEKLEDLQQFYPDRMTSRILGMGDVLSLIEKAEQTINEEDALRMTEKMKKAEFDLTIFLDQMDQMKKMGGFIQSVYL